jgi:hypothetical protein
MMRFQRQKMAEGKPMKKGSIVLIAENPVGVILKGKFISACFSRTYHTDSEGLVEDQVPLTEEEKSFRFNEGDNTSVICGEEAIIADFVKGEDFVVLKDIEVIPAKFRIYYDDLEGPMIDATTKRDDYSFCYAPDSDLENKPYENICTIMMKRIICRYLSLDKTPLPSLPPKTATIFGTENTIMGFYSEDSDFIYLRYSMELKPAKRKYKKEIAFWRSNSSPYYSYLIPSRSFSFEEIGLNPEDLLEDEDEELERRIILAGMCDEIAIAGIDTEERKAWLPRIWKKKNALIGIKFDEHEEIPYVYPSSEEEKEKELYDLTHFESCKSWLLNAIKKIPERPYDPRRFRMAHDLPIYVDGNFLRFCRVTLPEINPAVHSIIGRNDRSVSISGKNFEQVEVQADFCLADRKRLTKSIEKFLIPDLCQVVLDFMYDGFFYELDEEFALGEAVYNRTVIIERSGLIQEPWAKPLHFLEL